LGVHLAQHWTEYLEHDDTDHFGPLFASLGRIQPVQASDPIFPLITAADAAGAAELASCGKETDIPVSVANARQEAQRRLFATAPTTIEGARALAAHVLRWWPHFYDDISEPLKPLFEGMAPQPTVETVDPIYDVIARNWSAWLEYTAACNLPGAGVDGSPEDEKQFQLCGAYHVTLQEFGETRPTTFAGLAAIFEYVDTVDEFMDFGAHDPDQPAVLFRKMVAGVQALHLGMTANPSFSDSPPLSHSKLMDEIRARCRQEASDRNFDEALKAQQ
jgi:hypothetical protein